MDAKSGSTSQESLSTSGQSVPKVCRNCGKTVDADARFCKNCATPVLEADFTNVLYSPTSKRKVLIIGGIIFAVLLIAGGITAILLLTKTSYPATKEGAIQLLRDLETAVDSHNCDKAKSFYTRGAVNWPEQEMLKVCNEGWDAEKKGKILKAIDDLSQNGTWKRRVDDERWETEKVSRLVELWLQRTGERIEPHKVYILENTKTGLDMMFYSDVSSLKLMGMDWKSVVRMY
jgi:hypothetical protein